MMEDKRKADGFDEPIQHPDALAYMRLVYEYCDQPDAQDTIWKIYRRWHVILRMLKLRNLAESYGIDSKSKSGPLTLAYVIASEHAPGFQFDIFGDRYRGRGRGRPKGSGVDILELGSAVIREMCKEPVISAAEACRRLSRRRFNGKEKNPYFGENPRTLESKFSRLSKCLNEPLPEDAFTSFAREKAEAVLRSKSSHRSDQASPGAQAKLPWIRHKPI